jgi:putative acyltransferase
MKQRLLALDAIKGLAIMMVIMGHICYFGIFNGALNGQSYVYDLICAIHISFFIVVSGYFAQKSLTYVCNWGGYLQDKVIRLILPAVLWWLFFTFWKNGSAHLGGLYKFEYWFTVHLFLYFLIFACQRWFVDKFLSLLSRSSNSMLKLIMHITMMLGIYGVFRYAEVYLPIQLPESISFLALRASGLYPFFVIGFLIKYFNLIFYLRTHIAGVVAFLGCIVGLVFIRLNTEEVPYLMYGLWHPYRLLALSSFVLIFYALSYLTEKDNFIARALIFLGQWSLPIYLVHYFFIPRFPFLADYINSIDAHLRLGSELLIYFGGAVLTLVPTLAVIWCIKLNPYLDFFLFGEKHRLLKK